MTSPLNDRATRDFFAEHGHFGLPREDISFFRQGAMPAFDIETGRILMAGKDRVATSPDGHGGTLKALARSGALGDIKDRGIEHISYVQVDNPLARVVDPVFLGLHATSAESSAEMSTKAIAKTDPSEKVGVLCRIDGRTGVIEYSDLPDELAAARDADGRLTLREGSIAIHLIASSFVDRLTSAGDLDLPFHRAEKSMACIDPETGESVEPAGKNAVKLEMFIFDALPKAERSLVYEVDRLDEFAPIKNAEGADSPASSAKLQTERAARWLESRGVSVPRGERGEPDCRIEVSPLTATRAEELDEGELPERIEPGGTLLL
jgi:UDP-N-acetylglucosamine/UDP-N-acetylgalactosamine diphosphorylase